MHFLHRHTKPKKHQIYVKKHGCGLKKLSYICVFVTKMEKCASNMDETIFLTAKIIQ